MLYQHFNDDFHLKFLMLIQIQMQQLYVMSPSYTIVVWYHYSAYFVESRQMLMMVVLEVIIFFKYDTKLSSMCQKLEL